MRLTLIDGSGYVYRAHHAMPPLTRRSDGAPMGAVYGYTKMIWKCLTRNFDIIGQPTHIGVALDPPGRSFRSRIDPAYKANRGEPPWQLRNQFGLIREATEAMGVTVLELAGYEADDVMATYARIAGELGGITTIVSADKDMQQLVRRGSVTVLAPRAYSPDQIDFVTMTPEAVFDRWGVPPEMLADLIALMGDTADNITGAEKIGPVIGAKLLMEFGGLDALLADAGSVKRASARRSLIRGADQIRLARRLVALEDHAPTEIPIGALEHIPTDMEKFLTFLARCEFNQMIDVIKRTTQ